MNEHQSVSSVQVNVTLFKEETSTVALCHSQPSMSVLAGSQGEQRNACPEDQDNL